MAGIAVSRAGWISRIGFLAVLVLTVVSPPVSAQGPVGCPPKDRQGAPPTCTISGEPLHDDLGIHSFTPNNRVTFEVFASPGGPSFGRGSARTDAQGNGYGDLGGLRPRVDLVPGNQIVATDVATGTTKRHVISRVRLREVNSGNDSVTGTANPGERVTVQLSNPDAFATADTADSGRWTATFPPTVNITALTRAFVYAQDADGDQTIARPLGCPPVVGELNCAIDVHVGADFIFASMAPNSRVTIQVFDRRGGRSIYGPFTASADDSGEVNEELELAFAQGIDLVPGNYFVATDSVSRTTKRLELAALYIDRVDPVADVVAGRAPPGSLIDFRVGNAGTVLTAGPDGGWSVNTRELNGYDIDANDVAATNVFDADGDQTRAYRGVTVPDCDPQTSVCGTSATETLQAPAAASASGRSAGAVRRIRAVKAGAGVDTVLLAVARAAGTVTVDTGTGRVDKVVLRVRRGATGHVVVRGRSRRLVVALPANPGRLRATVTGGPGRDAVSVRGRVRAGRDSGGYRISGRGGNDSLRGGRGRDVLDGGSGRDTCRPGPGDRVRNCEVVRR